MTTNKRTLRTIADSVSEIPANGASPHQGVTGTVGNHHSPKERPMQPKLPKGATFLEQRKQALRARFSMSPLQPKEFQRLEDARWARQDPDVLARYAGEFVVPFERKSVAHGKDAEVVLTEAPQITGRPAEELPLVGVIDPLMDMPR